MVIRSRSKGRCWADGDACINGYLPQVRPDIVLAIDESKKMDKEGLIPVRNPFWEDDGNVEVFPQTYASSPSLLPRSKLVWLGNERNVEGIFEGMMGISLLQSIAKHELRLAIVHSRRKSSVRHAAIRKLPAESAGYPANASTPGPAHSRLGPVNASHLPDRSRASKYCTVRILSSAQYPIHRASMTGVDIESQAKLFQDMRPSSMNDRGSMIRSQEARLQRLL